MRSGYVDLNYGLLRSAGIGGYGWASYAATYSSATSATAYYLAFNASGFYPSGGPSTRWYGFPVRCLASGD